jgi:hypothetical protein
MAIVIIALLASEPGRVELGLRCLETKGLRPGQLQWSCGDFWSPSVQRGPGHSATCQGLLPAMLTEGEPFPPLDQTSATAGDGEGLLSRSTS